jgi:hypothetical protein
VWRHWREEERLREWRRRRIAIGDRQPSENIPQPFATAVAVHFDRQVLRELDNHLFQVGEQFFTGVGELAENSQGCPLGVMVTVRSLKHPNLRTGFARYT